MFYYKKITKQKRIIGIILFKKWSFNEKNIVKCVGNRKHVYSIQLI